MKLKFISAGCGRRRQSSDINEQGIYIFSSIGSLIICKIENHNDIFAVKQVNISKDEITVIKWKDNDKIIIGNECGQIFILFLEPEKIKQKKISHVTISDIAVTEKFIYILDINGEIWRMDLEMENIIKIQNNGENMGLCISSIDMGNQKSIITYGGTGSKIKLLEVHDDIVKNEILLEEHQDWVNSIVIKKNQEKLELLSASNDGKSCLWIITLSIENNIKDIKLATKMSVNKGWVKSSIFSMDQSKIFNITENGMIIEWIRNNSKIEMGAIFGDLNDNLGYISIHNWKFNLILRSETGTIHLWKLENDKWKSISCITGHTQKINSITWDPTENYLISASDDMTSRIFLFNDDKKLKEISRAQIHGYSINIIRFTGLKSFISGAEEKAIRIFHAPMKFIKTIESIQNYKFLNENPDYGIDKIPDDYGFLTALNLKAEIKDQVTHLEQLTPFFPIEFDLAGNTCWPEIAKIYAHPNETSAIDVSPDFQFFAAACKSNSPTHASLRIWRIPSRKPIAIFSIHRLTINDVSFSYDSKFLSSISRDRFATVYEYNSGIWKVYKTWEAHKREIYKCKWLNRNHILITCSRDFYIKAWQIFSDSDPILIGSFLFNGPIRSLAITPNQINLDYFIFLGGVDGWLYKLKFNLESGVFTLIDKIQSHLSYILDLAISKKYLASCGSDHKIIIYEL